MQRRCLVSLPVLIAACFGSPAYANEAMMQRSPLGEWRTSNDGGVIAINWCGDTLCGRIIGIKRSAGEPIPKDAAGKSQCDLTIITDAARGQDDSWFGHITDPRDDRQYQVEIWVDDQDQLHLRGYIGLPLFGRTEVWKRFTGPIGPGCEIA